MVSFKLRPLYSRGNKPRYPLDWRLDGPQSRSGRHKEMKILAPTGTRITDWSAIIAPTIITSVLDGGQLAASSPCRFTAEERVPDIRWIGGRVGLRTGLDNIDDRKSLSSARNRTAVAHLAASHYIDWSIPALLPGMCKQKYLDCS
jgi:hypothetical protein